MSLKSYARAGLVAVRDLLHRRKDRARWARIAPSRGPEPGSVEILVHFPDVPTNLYQLRMWYRPLERLSEDHPTAVVVRDVATALAVAQETTLPLVCLYTPAQIERWAAGHRLRLAFYVNQNSLNFQILRMRDPAHVFLNHGESEKDCMVTNQLKAYDRVFVAGQAAIDRLRRGLVDFDVDRRVVAIGRPQADVVEPGPQLPDDGRTVVLYAPTWEGDRPSMAYSSLRSHGPALLESLLASPDHRVILRAHPATGSHDPDYRRTLDRLNHRIEEANRLDPSARHMVDRTSRFGWQMQAADAAICDISAAAYSWLATGKPLVLAEPADPSAEVDRTGLVARIGTLRAEDAGTVAAMLDALCSGLDAPDYRAIATHYFGDTSPGAGMRRFLDASTSLLQERDRLLRGVHC